MSPNRAGPVRGRLLVVEDESRVTQELAAVLGELGYPVDAVTSRAEAGRRAIELSPDLVLMDVRLAGPTNVVTRSMTIGKDREVPIIYLTAHSDGDRVQEAAPFGYLVRPFRAPDLQLAIETALHKHQIEKQLRERDEEIRRLNDELEQLVATMESRLEEAARLRQALTAAAEEWRLSFDGVPASVIVLDAHGRIRRLNRAAASLAGREPAACIGVPVEDLAPGRPWISLREMWERRDGAYSQQLAVRDRAAVWNLSLHRISDSPDLWLGRASDITHDVRMLELAREEKQSAEFGRFVAGVAHEVRNPLFGILANLDALEDVTEGAFREYAGRIRREAERLRQLMADLLEYGKPSPPQIKGVDLQDVWKGIGEELQREALAARVHLEVAFPKPARVLADSARLAEVVANLVENAIQHTPRGGQVCLRGEGRGPRYECTVEDTGKGFVAEDLALVFEPFYSRRKGGTGLGLAIVKRFVEEMGGRVVASNRVDGGAAVVVNLRAEPGESGR